MLDFIRTRLLRQEDRSYPLSIRDYRTLPEGYAGPVFVWDIDKTYLFTHFSTFRGMSRIPLEFAVDKKAVWGMPEILRGLRRGPGPGIACAPLYFITASPPFLRSAIERRMLLDGVEFDGTTFKDWMKVLKGLRPHRLKEQVGYKICSLLEGRLSRPLATEYLFGDDVEQDARAFTLYAELLEGNLSTRDTIAALTDAGVREYDRRIIYDLCSSLPRKRGKVERVFIHLADKTPPDRFEHFGKRVVPVRSSFQLGLALHELSLVDEEAIRQCREVLGRVPGARRNELNDQLGDAVARGLISTGHPIVTGLSADPSLHL